MSHVSLVVASFFFILAWKLRPRPGAVLRVFLFSEFYFACAFCLDYLMKTNYGYLMQKPTNPSFLDYLGEWPYYLIALQILALIIFHLLYLPFRFGQNKSETTISPTTVGPRNLA
ncbi:MAG: YwaF family protein [Leptospirales bacterium]|nr:YwaF family protein [Leptospirales bacterium]